MGIVRCVEGTVPRGGSGAVFLEAEAEPPYRVESMLTQLLHAGVLAQQKVIMLGAFNRFTASSQDKGFAMKTVVQWLRANTKARVLTQLPHGHVSTKVMLPVGKTVDVMVQAKEALVFWSHDHSDTHSS